MDTLQLPFKASPEMIVALRAAEAAGEAIKQAGESRFSPTKKIDNEPVTQADVASNSVIRKILGEVNYSILSEETEDTEERLNQEFIWIVDPLDGTSNFIEGSDEFTVLIALVKAGQPQIGVILQPATNHWYIAEVGKGAWFSPNGREWERLRVTSTQTIDAARFMMSRHHLSESEKQFLDFLNKNDYIQSGSTGLKVARLCTGEADAYFTFTDKIKQWDVAAGHCILAEAGGHITDVQGKPIVYNTVNLAIEYGILASNGVLQKPILAAHHSFSGL
jgi:3'(2'), 5'-bisphosphate nucleotidase